jgi:ATP-dependent helicase HrpA
MDAFHSELSGIVPADFLRQFNTEQMTSAIRYCKALQIRMERAYVSPEKDKIKAAQLSPHTKRLQDLKPRDPSPACLELLQEYRSMLEEYKISLFAQEMKTLFPVSPKRLDKKWQEILYGC